MGPYGLRVYLALETTAIYRTGGTGRSKVLLERAFEATRDSKVLLERAFEATGRSKVLLERAFEATGRSKVLFEHASEPQRRSKSLFKHTSELQTLKIAAPATLLSHLALNITFKEAVRKSCPLQRCTLCHSTLLHFSSCMDMHGFTLVYISISKFPLGV